MVGVYRKWGGSFCIAPGCSNEYYRVKSKDIHFHLFPDPDKKPEAFKRWLAALKRKHPPSGTGQRVCSKHFLESDYLKEGSFTDEGQFVWRTTSRLKPDAVPSIFDFSGYSVGETDRPTTSELSGSAIGRRDRAHKRACQAEEREVSCYSTDLKMISVSISKMKCLFCYSAKFPSQTNCFSLLSRDSEFSEMCCLVIFKDEASYEASCTARATGYKFGMGRLV